MLIGTNIYFANSCEIVKSSGGTSDLLWKFSNYMQPMDYFSELGVGIVILCIVIAYPSDRLFWEEN